MTKVSVKLEWMDNTSINICTIEEFSKFQDIVNDKLVYPYETYYGNIYYCFDSPQDLFGCVEITEITTLEECVFKKLVGTYGIGLDIVESVLQDAD